MMLSAARPMRSLATAGAKRSVIAYEEWDKLSRVLSFGRLLMAARLKQATGQRRNPKLVAISLLRVKIPRPKIDQSDPQFPFTTD